MQRTIKEVNSSSLNEVFCRTFIGRTIVKFFLLLTFYCFTFSAFAQTLNDTILIAQENAIKNSPYADAKGFIVPKYQTNFRLDVYPELISNFLFNKAPFADTLWIVESFDFICPTCESYSLIYYIKIPFTVIIGLLVVLRTEMILLLSHLEKEKCQITT